MNKQRLLKLAEHLLHGKLGHERFDFGVVHQNGSHKEGFCGTASCAIGECPVVFTHQWRITRKHYVRLKDKSTFDVFRDARKFFDLSRGESFHLFHPEGQEPELYGGRFLGDHARRTSVAKNILAFIKKKESK